MPSLISGKRTRSISLAAAGALTVVGAISAAALTAPSMASAASAGSASVSSSTASPAFAHLEAVRRPAAAAATHQTDASGEVRLSISMRQYAAREAAAKQAAAEKAAHAAAARAAAKAAAKRAAKARAGAALSGSPQQIAQKLLNQKGEGSQFSCLQPLWGQESKWSVSANNPGSGAYGIPQALPGSKMASAGPDWQSSAKTQIKWVLQYIQSTYGSPCAAWSHEQSAGWY